VYNGGTTDGVRVFRITGPSLTQRETTPCQDSGQRHARI